MIGSFTENRFFLFLWGVHLSVLNCPVTAFFTDYVVPLPIFIKWKNWP
jgi:hypothetical protein